MGQGRNHQPGGGGNRMATASKKSKGKVQSSNVKPVEGKGFGCFQVRHPDSGLL
jgi:hypothetical protein